MSSLANDSQDSSGIRSRSFYLGQIGHVSSWQQDLSKQDKVYWLPTTHTISEGEFAKIRNHPQATREQIITLNGLKMHVKCEGKKYSVSKVEIRNVAKNEITCYWPPEPKSIEVKSAGSSRKRARNEAMQQSSSQAPQNLRETLRLLKNEVECLSNENKKLIEEISNVNSKTSELYWIFKSSRKELERLQSEDNKRIWERIHQLQREADRASY